MKTVVPAQITTVEDRISDNFTVRQFAILMVPVVISMVVVLAFPPYSGMIWYKWIIIAVVSVLFMPLIIRIKEKILLDWAVIYIRYLNRPKYYVYDKNTSYLRHMPEEAKQATAAEEIQEKRNLFAVKSISEREKLRLQALIEQGKVKVEYRVNKKGQLDVIATEIH